MDYHIGQSENRARDRSEHALVAAPLPPEALWRLYRSGPSRVSMWAQRQRDAEPRAAYSCHSSSPVLPATARRSHGMQSCTRKSIPQRETAFIPIARHHHH